MIVDQCPQAFIAEDGEAVEKIIEAAELLKWGGWPVAGGWGEQAAACVDGVRVAMDAIKAFEPKEKK